MSAIGRVACVFLGVMLASCANITVERIPWEPTHSEEGTTDGLIDGDSDADLDIDADSDLDAGLDALDDAGETVEDDAGSGVDAGGSSDAGAIRLDGGADAGSQNGHDAGTSACGGRSVFGLCWYLGAAGDSCNEACARNGGFDERATSYVGTSSQGGSLAECAVILSTLGITATVGEGKRSDNLGAGCHLWTDSAPWWLDDPSERFGPSEDASNVRIACACNR